MNLPKIKNQYPQIKTIKQCTYDPRYYYINLLYSKETFENIIAFHEDRKKLIDRLNEEYKTIFWNKGKLHHDIVVLERR